ncbi:MAG: HAMP domain-containing protein [Lachnospiraceae bacterium]|nr:HAMP domain-containing protein [Lachnospiraceae bacterium]
MSKKMLLAVLSVVGIPLVLLLISLFLIGGQAGEEADSHSAALLMSIAAAVLILGGILLLRWQQNHLSRPFKRLQEAAGLIRDGNLDFALSADSDDEFSQLFESFEEMRQRLKNNAEEHLRYEQDNKVLISNISHDLKTPITAIKGYVEGLRDGVASTPEKREKYLATIYNKADDMDKLVDQLAFYSMVEGGRIPYHFTKIPARAYFADCRWDFKEELDAQEFVTRYENLVPPDLMIVADPEQLHRVISNVISNSVKYRDRSKEKSILSFRIRAEEDQVLAVIEDNGLGIEAEDLPHVFERFYRSDASRSASTGGNGIGLSIVKKIMEDHGGRVLLESERGKGSRMTLILPVFKEKGHE